MYRRFFDLDPGPIALTFGLQPASPERIDSIEIPRTRSNCRSDGILSRDRWRCSARNSVVEELKAYGFRRLKPHEASRHSMAAVGHARDARSRDERIGARSELHLYRGFHRAKPCENLVMAHPPAESIVGRAKSGGPINGRPRSPQENRPVGGGAAHWI